MKEHVEDFFRENPEYPSNEPIKVKISCDGAKMSRSTNFIILSFSLLQTGDLVMSSKGNRTICIVNRPESYETLRDSFSDVINDINNTHAEVSEYDFRPQMCIIYQVTDDFLSVGSQRIEVKGTAGHLFR